MKYSLVIYTIVFFVSQMVGCNQAGRSDMQPVVASVGCPADAALSESDKQAFHQTITDNVRLALAGDWEAFASLYTEDLVLMPPNGPSVTGRTGIPDMFAAVTITEFSSRLTHVDGCADIAYGLGEHSWQMTIEGISEPVREAGKWVAVWRKQPDGQWLIAVDIWNSDTANQ
jgi:uncharacterized protein (TIGR02246 family)